MMFALFLSAIATALSLLKFSSPYQDLFFSFLFFIFGLSFLFVGPASAFFKGQLTTRSTTVTFKRNPIMFIFTLLTYITIASAFTLIAYETFIKAI